MAKIAMLEGISEKHSRKLEQAGVPTIEVLLERGATKKGRKEISKLAEVSEKEILNWVNRADLIRIKGIGGTYADLLENAGVDSVPELATRNPDHLFIKLQEINNTRKLVRAMPYLKQVRKWVGRAKDLPKVVTH